MCEETSPSLPRHCPPSMRARCGEGEGRRREGGRREEGRRGRGRGEDEGEGRRGWGGRMEERMSRGWYTGREGGQKDRETNQHYTPVTHGILA